MNPKQKRAYNKAGKALAELGAATVDDQDAYNAALAMIARAMGSMIGAASGLHGLSGEDLHAATMRAAGYVQRHAAEAYAIYLAHERAGQPTQ